MGGGCFRLLCGVRGLARRLDRCMGRRGGTVEQIVPGKIEFCAGSAGVDAIFLDAIAKYEGVFFVLDCFARWCYDWFSHV